MAPVSMPDSPPGYTGTTQPFEMPSATPPSPSPSREHDPLTGDSATGESPQSQAPRLSVVLLATTTPPATEPPNPETGDSATGESLQSQELCLGVVSLATTTPPATEPPNLETRDPPPAQTPDAIPNMVPIPYILHNYPPTGNPKIQDLPRVARTQSQGAGPSAAYPTALLGPSNTGTGHPPPQAPDPIEPNPQVAIDLHVIPHDAQVEEAQQQQPAQLDEEAQRPRPERLGSWCRVAWTCRETVTFMVAVVVGFIAIIGVVWGIAHTLNNRGTSMPTNRQ